MHTKSATYDPDRAERLGLPTAPTMDPWPPPASSGLVFCAACSEESGGEAYHVPDLPSCAGQLLAALLLALLLPLAAGAEEERAFRPVPVDQLATGTIHTHVETSGRVDFRRSEEDGDVHLRICGSAGCVVAECIPEISPVRDACKRFRKGSLVVVRGISRYDGKHRWWEIHPVLGVEGGRP